MSIFTLAVVLNKTFLFIGAVIIYYFNFEFVDLTIEDSEIEGTKFKDIIIVLLVETLLLLVVTAGKRMGFFSNYLNLKELLDITAFMAICLSILVIILVQELYELMKRKVELEKKEVKLKGKKKLIEELRSSKHDFSNHLQTIYSMVQLDKKREVKEYIHSLNEDLKNLELNTASGEITALESLLIPFESQAAKEKVDFDYNIEEGIEGVNCSLSKLCRIISNLVENALEAIEDFEGEKLVKVKGVNKKDEYVLWVYNKGPIINQQKINSIFEIGVSEKGSNRGFGMYIVNSLIKEVGGRIKVKSEEDFGTQFTCYFPKT